MWVIQVGSSCSQEVARKLSICIITRFREKDNRKSRLIFTSGKCGGGRKKFSEKGKKGRIAVEISKKMCYTVKGLNR